MRAHVQAHECTLKCHANFGIITFNHHCKLFKLSCMAVHMSNPIKLLFNLSNLEQKVLYGKSLTIYCGDSDPNTPPGDWYHDGAPLGVYNRSYTIANATFDDDGEYECRRNGTNVSSFPLLVNVYGKN